MAYDLEDKLVVAISSRALFDLNYENELFETEGLEKYIAYQVQHENDVIPEGTAYSLIKGLLNFNEDFEEPIVEVIVMSRNSPETGLRIFNTIDQKGLNIKRAAFSGGESIAKYLAAFKVDLFLSMNQDDVQEAINAGFAAAMVYDTPMKYMPSESELRLAFDGDAVIFSEESELIYKNQGLEAFAEYERQNALKPLPDGPFAKLFRALFAIKKRDPSKLRIALVTARNSPAHKRVIMTFREWGVNVDEAFFLGGVPKNELLKAFNPHIFFDDQETHLNDSSKEIPAAKVLYKSESEINKI
ncbi:MAG: 5'-nucleotidase [Bacillota bacterium]|nr:5'-nucleotidase [Bacillota bacterium]